MKRLELDQVGAAASVACAIHCAALPIALSFSAGGALSFLDNRPVEVGLVLLAGVVGTTSAWRGWKRHGNKTVAVVLASAAVGLVFAMFSHHDHPDGAGAHDPSHLLAWVFPLIGAVIAVAHIVNLRLCRACSGCATHEHAEAPAPR